MTGKRTVFVDILRLLATFQMVQGHTLDAILATGARQAPWFAAWTWIRGLTSVAFLVAAGMSFHLATLVRFERHRQDRDAVRHRIRRGLWLVFLGYLMHFPFGSAFAGGTAPAAWMEGAVVVDVLQCIGVTLVVLEGLTLLAPSPAAVVAAAGAIAVGVLALVPWSLALAPDAGPRWLVAYLTSRGGSVFPLVPWSAWMLGGVVLGWVALPAGPATEPRSAAGRLGASAVLLLAVGGGPWGLPPVVAAGLVKLGVLVLACALLAAATAGVPRLPRRLEVLAGESLVIYVAHVVFLYAAGVGLADRVGPTVPLAGAVAVAGGLIVASVALGLAWHAWKAWGGWRRLLGWAGRAS